MIIFTLVGLIIQFGTALKQATSNPVIDYGRFEIIGGFSPIDDIELENVTNLFRKARIYGVFDSGIAARTVGVVKADKARALRVLAQGAPEVLIGARFRPRISRQHRKVFRTPSSWLRTDQQLPFNLHQLLTLPRVVAVKQRIYMSEVTYQSLRYLNSKGRHRLGYYVVATMKDRANPEYKSDLNVQFLNNGRTFATCNQRLADLWRGPMNDY